MTIPYAHLQRKWEKDPEFQKEFEALHPSSHWRGNSSYQAGLSQSVAGRGWGTSQPRWPAYLKSLERYAEAVGMRVEIHLVAG